MSVSSRVQYAMIAVALLPCWATAQSNLATNSATDAAVVGSSVDVPTGLADQPQSNASSTDIVATPQANLQSDPIPADANTSPSGAPSSDQVTSTTGPTSSAATAGFRSHSVTENLTRQQMADRAANADHNGLGRNVVLMIIGGAAIVTGAIVGGGAGTALIVVGAVVGITGLVLVLAG
jgi:hypothetical protein